MDIKAYQEIFTQYIDTLCTTCVDEEIRDAFILKKEHSLRVLEHAEVLIEKEKTLLSEKHSILLGALWHDVGRFPQFARYKTFKDAQSCNHGFLGVQESKRHAFLQKESVRIQKHVHGVIALHNAYILPKYCNGSFLSMLNAVRDCDRVDIFYTIASALSSEESNIKQAVALYAKDVPDRYNEKVLVCLKKREMVLYSDILYHNDIRLMLFSWIYHFSFSSSLARIDTDSIESLYTALPYCEDIEQAYIVLQEYIYAQTT